jgi:predicted ATP-binding protein involved in virulence
MRIDKLELVNFRCFERWERDFSPGMNVLIGRNGSGKTAVLEALANVVRPFLRAVGHEVPYFPHSDVRVVPFSKGRELTLEPQNPMSVRGQGALSEHAWKASWTFQLVVHGPGKGPSGGGDDDLGVPAQDLAEAVRKGEDVSLPLIAFFGTDRLWRPASNFEPTEALGPGSRLRGYSDCLRPASGFQQLAGWFKRMAWIKAQDGEAPPMYDAVRAAVANCLEGWDEVLYHPKLDSIIARTSDGSRALPFHMLSDGVRNMIGMVGEIAYRAALLNPHLGADAAKKTPGVVLVDELDLHLHPSWQRRVVGDLRRTFPEMQFFGTTRSPIIVQSLLPGELIDLGGGQPSDHEHRSVEDILENEMDLSDVQRSKRWQDMKKAAEEYYRVLQEASGSGPEVKARLKQRLDELSGPFSQNPAHVAFLEMEREAVGLGRSGA